MIIDETRERFLRAIVAQVDPSRIAEIHFFAPIKQGGVESGIAVVAAITEAQAAETAVAEPAVSEAPVPEAAVTETPVTETPVTETPVTETPVEDAPLEEAPREDAAAVEGPPSTPKTQPPNPQPARLVIYTARYRLTLKGIDRGKWETNVVAEADAPLVTVDAVVRGVQRRSGDLEDPIRMHGDEVRGILDAIAANAALAATTTNAAVPDRTT